ncbi:helix-turn-helix domain-containing protein [Epibacterium sp. SM1979]|uniref:Helix-turn-helix domain-containing protein n=1 Tax=Tritonibacter litoralis TaxID=2662264 RepID=A0A843YJ52_9RHOB|nr:AraC family transcriptional regulator [Tritonibacter litoralis]MQQ09263.1 helix-turn-helix domain-containing protein [Tritonibacter litoralis]
MEKGANITLSHTVPVRRPGFLVQDVVQRLHAKGVLIEDLFPLGPAASTVLDGEAPDLSFSEAASFFEHAARVTEQPDFGFLMGLRRDFRLLGLVAYSALSAATLAEFLNAFSRNLFCYSGGVQAKLTNTGKMVWQVTEQPHLPHRQYLEFLVTLLFKAARMYLEPRSGSQVLSAKAVWLDLSDGNRNGEREAFWGCPLIHETGRFEIHFNGSDLRRQMRNVDPFLSRLIEGFATLQAQEDQRLQNTLVHRLRTVMYQKLADPGLTQEAVAQELGMSVRTLSRELQRLNMRFFEELDDIRQDLACRYLYETEWTSANVAEQLGYASVSSFNDAFRRWTSTTPTKFRRKVRATLER